MTALEALAFHVGRLIAAELVRALRAPPPPPPEEIRPMRADARPIRALRYLQACTGRAIEPAELGAHLGINNQAAAVILRRLALRGAATRVGTGLYRARTHNVERPGEDPRSLDAVGDGPPSSEPAPGAAHRAADPYLR